MTRKKTLFASTGTVAAILLVYFLLPDRVPEKPPLPTIAANPHAHEETDHGFGDHVHGEPRLSKILQETAEPESAGEPLLQILSQETLLSGPFMAPRFAADGKHIILSGESYNGLWVANSDGTGLRQITDGFMAGWRPVTTKDGHLVYRTAQVDKNGVITGFTIFRHNLETGTEEIVYQGENEDIYPPWLSRDEDMLFIRRDAQVLARPINPAATQIPLHDRDEGFAFADAGQVSYYHVGLDEVMPLSSDPEATGGEATSPDGRRVAYLSGNTDSALIVNLDTGTEIDIGEGANLSWSPDGKLLLYDISSDDGHRILQSALFVVDATGETRQRLTFGDTIITNASWAPDGEQIIAGTADGEILTFRVARSNKPKTESK